MQIDQEAIQAAIIERASSDILDQWDWRDEARAMVRARIDKAFAEGLDQIVTDTINAAVQAGFDHEYRRIDRFGRPEGPVTTIRRELNDLITNYWQQKVDKAGKPADSAYGTTTRAEYLMVQICGASFSDQVKQEAVNVAATMKDSLREQLRANTDRMLGELFRVRSVCDKEEGRRA